MADIDLLFTVADSSQSDILNTFKALQATINSSYTDIKYKVDPSAKAEIEALTASIKNLNDVSKKGGIKPSSAKSTVAKEAKEVEAAYHKIISLKEQINKKQIQLLSSKNTPSDISRITREIDQLTQKRNELAVAFKGRFSPQQFQDIHQHAATLKAELEELQHISAEQLQLKINSGSFTKEIDAVEAKFKKLGTMPDSVRDKIEALRTAFAGIKSSLDGGDLTGARSAAAEYVQTLSLLNAALKGTSGAQADFDANSERVAALQERVSTALKDTSPAAMAYRGQLKHIAQALKEIQSESPTAAADIKKLEESFKETESSISRLQGAFGKVGSFLKTGMTQLFGISSGFMALRKGVQEVKKMYGEVVKIDSSMINLRKVTDETEDTYDSFLKSASKDAQKLGTTISGLVDQTATWAKLGYSINEAADLSKISTMYEKVGEVSGETAVSDMVTALKAFNLEASDAITVVDRLNELGKQHCPAA